MSEYILEVQNITKSFPGVKALNDVSIQIRHGQIHAFVGENGAGKSTLLKIINGNYQKDSGTILCDGKKVEIRNPKDTEALGISIVFQELNQVPTISVAENLLMGRLPKKGRFVDWKETYRRGAEALKKIGYDLDPRTPVSKLSVAQRQMVEIAKAISFPNTKLILMDEPTATLTSKECQELFKVIRELKAKGIAVIYISHKLEEIFEICEWVTILRDGQIIDSQPIENFTANDITSRMIGRELSQKFPKRQGKPGEKEIFKVEHLSQANILKDISFSLKEGEILGMAGLVGAGRTEMARALVGVDFKESGDIWIRGKKVTIQNPADAIKKGLCYLSEDRRGEGFVGQFSVKWNISLANLRNVLKHGILNNKKEMSIAEKAVDAMLIRTPSLEQKVYNLSGGNQQKVVIGKWLNTDVSIYIFDEPTRGIDVGAKAEIYQLINELADSGKSIIFISSELPEILGVCDRILVMRQGAISAELKDKNISAQAFIENAI